MACTELSWSDSTADQLSATIIVCSIAIVIHIIFWIQIASFPSLRHRNMMWLYAYLITDFFLLSRFFILYSMRRWHLCLNSTLRIILCYFEASSKFYVNVVQSYILLALNVCRCVQIIFSRNVYTQNIRLIILSHFLIYLLPAINVMIQFLAQWTILWRRTGESCDIQYDSLSVQIFNLFAIYIVPVTINMIILTFCIRHISSTQGIHNQQIIDRRRKNKKNLLIQTIIFYSIWISLWSPNILAFQFVNINTEAGIYTSLLTYIQITIDPIIVAALDIRFFQTWKIVWRRIRICRKGAVTPALAEVRGRKY